MLRDWIEGDTFVWLVSNEILLEYKRVLGRLGVRRPLIGKIVNLLREEAELFPASALPNISPDPGDDPFCACAESGQADFIVTLNPKDFPQQLLSANVIRPGERVPTTARRRPRRSSESRAAQPPQNIRLTWGRPLVHPRSVLRRHGGNVMLRLA
jgi:predicted nucleic acid-binding protein